MNLQKIALGSGGRLGRVERERPAWVGHLLGRHRERILEGVSLAASAVNAWAANPGAETSQLVINTRNSGAVAARVLVRCNDIRFPQLSTTASAGNAFLDSANQNNLLRSTSSLHWGYRDEDYKERVIERDPETGVEVVELALKPGAKRVPDGVQ